MIWSENGNRANDAKGSSPNFSQHCASSPFLDLNFFEYFESKLIDLVWFPVFLTLKINSHKSQKVDNQAAICLEQLNH